CASSSSWAMASSNFPCATSSTPAAPWHADSIFPPAVYRARSILLGWNLPLHGPFTALWSRFGARRAAFAKWNDHHCLLNQRFVIPGQLLRNAFHGLFIAGLLVGLE